MRTFLSTSSEDLALDSAGNLSVISGADAVLQTSRQYVRARRGEMIHNVHQGVPYDPIVWSGTPNIAQFEAAVRARLLQMPEVAGIRSLVARLEGNVLGYTAVISTASGEVTVSG